jgi:hypothetical protein
MAKDDPIMSPVQFSLKAALLAMLLFAVASAILSRLVRQFDETERLRAAYMLGGILVGALIGAGLASLARSKIHRTAGKRLLVVPASNMGVLTMKVGMALIVVLWCAVVWVIGVVAPPYVTLLSALIAFPVRWLCRFPRYLELFENGVVYGSTVYFPWRRFRTFRFAVNALQLDFLIDVLNLSIPTDYIKAVDEILSRHIARWESPPRDWFASEQT